MTNGDDGVCDGPAEVVRQLEYINRSVEELSAQLARGQTTSVGTADEKMRKAFQQHIIDYTNVCPEVEVTAEFLEVSSFNVVDATFWADIVVHLDWEEYNFVENIHYSFDHRTQKPKLTEMVLESEHTFNPAVYIDNGVEVEVTKSDAYPRIHRHVSRKNSKGTEVESAWLTKMFHFVGMFKVANVDARVFPFDMHQLAVKVRSRPLPGTTTLGDLRIVRLKCPLLRRYEELEYLAAERNRRRTGAVAINFYLPLRPDRFTDEDLAGVHSHHWKMVQKSLLQHVDEVAINVRIGELSVCAFGGRTVETHASDAYQLEVVVVRDWRNYLFDFVLRILMVFVGLCSVFVPYTPDALSSRLGITLTINLTLVTFTIERPSAVEELTYETWYDRFSKIMFGFSLITAFENLVAFVHCYGTFRYGMDESILGYGGWFEESDLCMTGMCHSTKVDCIFFFFAIISTLLIFIWFLISGQQHQIALLIDVERVLHRPSKVNQPGGNASDGSAGKPIGSLMVRVDSCSKVSTGTGFDSCDSDIKLARALAWAMPLLPLAPRLWVWCARRRCSFRWGRRLATQTGQQTLRMLGKASSARIWPIREETSPGGNETPGIWLARYLGKWPIIEPAEPVQILDIGTGETGFYRFHRRRLSNGQPLIYMKGDKVSTNFMEQFVRNADGVQKFVDELINNFFGGSSSPLARSNQPLLGDTKPCTSGTSGTRQKKKILIGPTGKVRQMLTSSERAMREFEEFIQNVTKAMLDVDLLVELILFVPGEDDSATCELLATEWLVQHGDLDVMRIQPGANNEPFAGFELNQAFMRARGATTGGGDQMIVVEDFLREFNDLKNAEIDVDFLARKFEEAAMLSGAATNSSADFSELCLVFRESPSLMRALVRNRLFQGTIAAGGGAVQVAVKREAPGPQLRRQSSTGSITSGTRLRSGEILNLPVGNRTPLIGDGGPALLPKEKPPSTDMVKAWKEQILQEWSRLNDNGEVPSRMDGKLRGLFVGISAVFYAAKRAECTELILPKAEFLKKLDAKLNYLIENPPAPKSTADRGVEYDHKDVSNLALVHTVVDKVLHDTAWIVCKRQWKAQLATLEFDDEELEEETPEAELPEYVATWVLGFYLNQSHLLARGGR
eukprot:TRINITY_DN30090_c0_g1_i1.p1 TRINITY_DN30090_c0_g1~~TRINITY_DN30090_c0_g1_i1.p1  ORF type:complete len:1131 (-),score=166.54 TRINITY_DN30090_c0_g1_i1:141-3533(-)